MDEAANALEALANTLTLLTENPYDISLHAQNVRLARATGMEDQLEAALDMVKTFWASGDHVWVPLIDLKTKSADLQTAQGLRSILHLFERAEEDYLSVPLLKKHLQFIIDQDTHFRENGTRPADFGELFSTEWTLGEMQKVVSRGSWHLSESHQLWELQREHIMELLEGAKDEEKELLASHMESLFLLRLKQPHANHDETFQSYSSFTTSYKPADEYESILVQASKLRGQAVKTWERRERSELALAKAGFSLEGYAYYISTERRAKKPDMFLLTTLYERAITEADRRRWKGEVIAEEALRSFWTGYLDLLRKDDVAEGAQLKILKRATRSVPGSGEIWARYIRFLERTGSSDSDSEDLIQGVYENALSIPLLSKNVQELVPVVLAVASYERRKLDSVDEEEQPEAFNRVIAILTEGIGKGRKASPQGDPRLRLERFLSALCTEVADAAEHAVIMWEDATKFYKTSYLAWTAYTDLLIKQHLHDDARKIFRDVAMKNLDWPEAIWESWIQFEQLHGSVEQLDDCLDRVNKARDQINARRVKEAEKAAYEAMQAAAEQQATSAPVQEVSAPAPAVIAEVHEEVAIDVDATAHHAGEEGSSTKRKAEDEGHAEGSKKARVEPKPAPLKRDRENSTVFVADLPANTTEDDLKSLFKDCGPIREIKITQLQGALVATVEFMDRESVPAALTKDKKRIHGEEVAVHLAWQSTLYVTNFSEDADDAFVRELFGKYGTLFDVRWPSKKFKGSRRFCYVQYTSPDAAKAALQLHGQELAPGLPLSVFISNPERKKERTDSDANEREVYVAGLSKFVTKHELEELFKTYGPVKEVRMALDDKGHPKGFAFVEFENEKDALASLAANNHEIKKRRIAVTIADTRRTKRSSVRPVEVKSRSVRLRNLPAGTQEGLLQQMLEKRVQVKRLEVFLDKNEAIVELENPAEASKLLLDPAPLIFNGSTLQLSEESLEAGPSHNAAPSTGLFVPRTALSRPRAGLGSKKTRTIVSHATAATATSATSLEAPTTGATGAGRASASVAKGQDDFRKMLSGS